MLAAGRTVTALAMMLGGERHADLDACTAATLGDVTRRLADAGAALRTAGADERIAALDRVALAWLSAGSPWRRDALARLPRITGYPPRAIATALDNLWQALRAPDLAAQARLEADALAAVDARLALHILAGNVPGAGIFGVVAALLAGVPSLVKTAGREPLLPRLIAASVAEVDARLGAALAVVHWPSADDAATRGAIAAADVVLAYGRAATLDAVAHRCPRRLLRFGPRLSIALIARDTVGRNVARELAWQTALYDQQGCLSPQLVIVEETTRAATTRFAVALADELARLDGVLPPAPATLAEATAVGSYLERQRWRAQEGADVTIDARAGGGFSVACDRTGAPIASPLRRHLTLVPVPALRDAADVVATCDGVVEAVGFSGPERRIDDAAALAVACSASRLCPLDRMQAPPFSWRQSGHPRLGCFAAPRS